MNTRSIADLRPHPKNAEIYGDYADADLVESVRINRVLTPLLITEDGVVINGHRRLDAARRNGLAEVPVVVFESTDDLDILEAMVESNRQRTKTNEQIGREFGTFKYVYHERLSRQGQRSDLSVLGSTTSGNQLPEVPEPP
jgi:ParB family chromosome partitioning protein